MIAYEEEKIVITGSLGIIQVNFNINILIIIHIKYTY